MVELIKQIGSDNASEILINNVDLWTTSFPLNYRYIFNSKPFLEIRWSDDKIIANLIPFIVQNSFLGYADAVGFAQKAYVILKESFVICQKVSKDYSCFVLNYSFS